MLSYSAMNVADTAFVGMIGPAALAGVGLAATLAFTSVVFGIGLLRAVRIVASMVTGADKKGEIEEVAAAGLLIAIAMGVIAIGLAQVIVLLVPVLSASEEAGVHGSAYFLVRMLGTPIVYIFFAMRETSYGSGNTRSAMFASLIANIVNIGLDYVFIVGLDFGAAGVAWATVFASVLEAGILIVLIGAPGFRCLAKGRRKVFAILHFGWATGLQFLVEVGAFAVLTILIAAMSETQMAAHHIVFNVMKLGNLPLFAISEAASVMTGQAIGAERKDLVWKIAIYALLMCLGYALFCSIVVAVGSAAIITLFTDDEAVRSVATGLFYAAIIVFLSRSFNVVSKGVLRGVGDVRVPALLSVIAGWLVLPLLTWLLGLHLGMGALGAWIAFITELTVLAVILWWRVWKGGWHASAAKGRRVAAG